MSDEEPINDASLAEHPHATQARLVLSGEWPEALALKGSIYKTRYNYFKKRRGLGVSLSLQETIECNKAAWDAVLNRWPPPEGTEPLLSVAEFLKCSPAHQRVRMYSLTLEAEARFAELGEPDDAATEIMWVHHNLETADVDPFKCPSRGAWTMLGEARSDKKWFYEKMYKPIVALLEKRNSEQASDKYEPSKAERRSREELRAMIAEAVALSATT